MQQFNRQYNFYKRFHLTKLGFDGLVLDLEPIFAAAQTT